MSNSVWSSKYTPKHIKDITDNDTNINKITCWLNSFKDDNEKLRTSNALFIEGGSGIGKKTTIKLILEKEKFQIKYIYFDKTNSIKNQLDSLDYLSVNSIFNNKKNIAIVIEEIDTIINSTKSSCKLFINYFKKKCKLPFIFIYNINNDINHKSLSKESINIKFNKSSNSNLKKFVTKVFKAENIKLENIDLDKLIDILQYDYRRTLYILENIKFYFKEKVVTEKDLDNIISVFLKKNLSIELNDALNKIYNSKLDINKSLELYNTNCMKLPMLIHENFIKNIKYNLIETPKDKLKKIDNYYNYITDAYIIQSKIFELNNWDLSDYVGILSTTVPNVLLNSSEKKKKYKTINPSPIYSKINYRFYNLKFINSISKKININVNNFQNFSFKVYKLFVLADLKEKNALEYANYLKSKKILFLDIDKTIKISYLYAQYRNIYTSKKRKDIEKIFLTKI